MNNRPTPETAALEQKQASEGCPQWNDMMRWVREHAALARKLERERDGAREQIEVCRGIIERTVTARNSALSDLTDLERELDEAREALKQIWQSGYAFLPYIDKETTNRWRKAAGWEETK